MRRRLEIFSSKRGQVEFVSSFVNIMNRKRNVTLRKEIVRYFLHYFLTVFDTESINNSSYALDAPSTDKISPVT